MAEPKVKVGKIKAKKTSAGRAYGGFSGKTKSSGGLGRMALAIPGMAEAAKSFGKGGGASGFVGSFGAGATGGGKATAPGQQGRGTTTPPVGGANYDTGAYATSNPRRLVEKTNLPGQQGVGGTQRQNEVVQMPLTNKQGGVGKTTTATAPAATTNTRERAVATPAPKVNAVAPGSSVKAPAPAVKAVVKAPTTTAKAPTTTAKAYASAPKTEGTAVRAQPLTKAPSGGVSSTKGASIARRGK